MGKYYFYTNPNELNASQDVYHAFGPITDPSDPQYEADKDKYRITNFHTTTQQAPAVAICDGTICIVEDDSGGSTVTIVLKPHYQPGSDFPFLKYFLFKGIKRSSIINGNAVVLNTDIPFTRRLDESWDEDGGVNSKANSAMALGLAYTQTITHPTATNSDGSPIYIFADEQPIDNLFYANSWDLIPNMNFCLPTVKAGEFIGFFDSAKFGLEIIIERLGFNPIISRARTLENIISVDRIAPNNITSDNSEYSLHWHKKEKCLNYLDPCAFYGSFLGSKIYFKNSSNGEEWAFSPQQKYDYAIKHYRNRNLIYLDIRNDFNLSHNYFKNYGYEIRFKGSSNPSIEISKDNSNWPIYTLDLSKIRTSGTVSNGCLKTALSIAIGNNDAPFLYFSKAYTENYLNYKKRRKAFSPTVQDGYTSPVDIWFSIVNEDQDLAFCSAYYKVNYYNKSIDPNLSSDSLFAKRHYLNGMFRPWEMLQSISIHNTKSYRTIWHEEVLVNLEEYGGQSFIGYIGISQDEVETTLFAFPICFLPKTDDQDLDRQTIPVHPVLTSKASNSATRFIQEIIEEHPTKVLSKEEYWIGIDNHEVTIVENRPTRLTKHLTKASVPEDYVYIIFDNEFFQILLDTQAPNSINYKFLSLRDLIHEEDNHFRKFSKLALDMIYQSEKNGKTITETSHISTDLYGAGQH